MKTILITGTRKGIGRGLAEHYILNKWRVFGCSRGESTVTLGNYRHWSLDITDESVVVKMLGEIGTHWELGALVNNAGIASMNHCLLTPLESVRKVFETNVLGAFLLCREAAKLMQRRTGGGRIVNLTSVASPLNLEGEAAYAASKAAVESLTRTLARELAPFKITVNAVGPGPIQTDLVKGIPEYKMQDVVNRQAIPRWGTVADVANVVDFFLRPESDFITGQIIYLGGVN